MTGTIPFSHNPVEREEMSDEEVIGELGKKPSKSRNSPIKGLTKSSHAV